MGPGVQVVAGDSNGCVHLLDSRAAGGAASVACLPLHKKGNKVVSVSVHPRDPSLILTAGNDHTARLFDVRSMTSNAGPSTVSPDAKRPLGPHSAELACMQHSKVVNAAYFSPLTGNKIMTTCQDNRLRVWDYMLTADRPADREIVHSHDFNR